jgi:outer membrane protein
MHHESEVQNRGLEWVVALKLYYTFNWRPVVWRFGAAEGLSYVKEIPYVERQSMYEKDYRPSELLNYLDFSLDISLGHLFKVKSIEELWLGCSIHHRSGIFSSSSAFGRVSGGSNYNSIYLQYHW